MADSPRISVVLIFLNAEKFIGEAVESVCAQTFADWELLAVDDGSTDRSAAIVGEFARHHPGKISVLRHPGAENRGMSASRNLGISHSRGPYVTFLDADDAFLPDKLEHQAALLDNHPEAEAILCPNQRWYSWGADGDVSREDVIQHLGVPLDQLARPPQVAMAFLADPAATPLSLMIRRLALDRIGGYENQFRGMYEDTVVMSKVFLNLPVYVSSRVTYRYRQHPESCVSRSCQSGQHHAARQRFLTWLRGYLRRADLVYPEVAASVREELKKVRVERLRQGLRRPLQWLLQKSAGRPQEPGNDRRESQSGE